MKTGIIIANTGSPASPEPDAIESYLREFLMDDRICQMPRPLWKWLVFRHILPKRKFTSAERYRFIWNENGSPLIYLQERLAKAVGEELAAGGDDVMVRSAMSYGQPGIASVLREMRDADVERLVLLPLYPQSAYSPTLAVIDAFNRARKEVGWRPPCCIIDNYHDNALYIDEIARRIRDLGFDAASGDRLMLSFHAIPLKDERAGDTYRTQTRETARLVAERLGIDPASVTVSYQSVFGHNPKAWASPLSLDVLESWRSQDFRVFFACPGFAIDCLETMYDIPQEMVPALEGAGAKPANSAIDGSMSNALNPNGRFVWVPCLNDSQEHVRIIADVLRRNIGKSAFGD
jgi:ferrochelatase